MYFEGEDAVVLRVREPDAEDQTLAALVAVLGAEFEGLLSGRTVRTMEAAYDWRELKGWYEAALPVWETGVVTSSDINEALNRIVFGVAPGADSTQVRGVLDGLGIPVGAAMLEERAMDEYPQMTDREEQQPAKKGNGCGNSSLDDLFCPLVGGITIDGEDDPDGMPNKCTLGFVVRSITSLEPNSFVTNSHCTQIRGGGNQPEGTLYYQPTETNGLLIGQEIRDPDYSSTLAGCPSGDVCRYSDAALIGFSAGTNGTLGYIARTTEVNDDSVFTGSAPIAIGPTPYRHRFDIVQERTTPYMGLPLNKVGQTTGWTQGRVTGTCVSSSRSGDITFLCQYRMNSLAAGSDSGSPVFSLNPLGTPEMIEEVTLYGLLNGRNRSSGESIFSRIDFVEQELGTLIIY